MEAGQSGISAVLGGGNGSVHLLLGGVYGVAVFILGGGGGAAEADIVIGGNMEGGLVILVILLDLLIGIVQAIEMIVLEGGEQNGILGHFLENTRGHQGAVHGLDIILIGVTGLFGGLLEGLDKIVIVGLHIVRPGEAVLFDGGQQGLAGRQVRLRLVKQVLIPGDALIGDTQKGFGRIGHGLAGQALTGVNTHIAIIIGGTDLGISGVVAVLHLSGGIILVPDGQGGLAALNHIGVPQQDQNGYHYESHGNGAIEQRRLALLGLFLRGTDGLGVCSTAGGEGLAVLFFSGCTHGWFIPLVW